jgi:hypothetical protein
MAVDGLKVATEKRERIHTRMKKPLPIDFMLILLSVTRDFWVGENFFSSPYPPAKIKKNFICFPFFDLIAGSRRPY